MYLVHHWFNWPGAGERHAIIGSNDGVIANPNYLMVITETCVIKWLLLKTDGSMLFQRYIIIWSLWKHISYDDLVNFNVGGNELITPVDWPSRSGNHLPLSGDTLSDICFDWQVVGGSTTASISGPAFNSVVEYRIFSWNINTFKMTQYIAQDCKANQWKITYLHKVCQFSTEV